MSLAYGSSDYEIIILSVIINEVRKTGDEPEMYCSNCTSLLMASTIIYIDDSMK
jgi:hypothetical protein